MTIDGSTHLLELLDIQWPVIQAPMAGVGTPSLAAAVSNAGGLGSLGVGATNAEGAKKMIAAFRALSARSLNVNVFCHQPAKADARLENAWIERLRPEFARSGATPPTHLTEIYRSFLEDNDILANWKGGVHTRADCKTATGRWGGSILADASARDVIGLGASFRLYLPV